MTTPEPSAPPVPGTGRGRGVAALILGWFAAMWFAWGSAEPTPRWLTLLLQVGTVLALLVVVLGIVLAVRSPAESTPARDPAVRRQYGRLIGVEFAVIGIGSLVLGLAGLSEWIPVWVCAGVGIHFFPLSTVLGDPGLVVLGGLVTAVAVVALVVGSASGVAPGTVTGVGAGWCLLGSAALTLADRNSYSRRLTGASRAG